jgi:hypothetical protein
MLYMHDVFNPHKSPIRLPQLIEEETEHKMC